MHLLLAYSFSSCSFFLSAMAEEGDYDTVCTDTGQNAAGDEDTEYQTLCRDKVQRTHTTSPAGGEESAYDNLCRDKQKKPTPTKAEKNAAAVSAGPDAVYSALTTRKGNLYDFPPDNDANESKDTYSMINLSQGKKEVVQTPVAESTVVSVKTDKSKCGSSERLITILVAVMLVLAAIMVACFAAIFLEIAKLKEKPAEISTVATVTDSSAAQLMDLQQLNHTFLDLNERVVNMMNQIAAFNETISKLVDSKITTNQNLRNRLSNLNESITEQIAVNRNFTDELSRLDHQGANNSARLVEASQGLLDLEQRVDAQNFVNFQDERLRLNDTVASILSNLTDECVLSTCYSSCADVPSSSPSGYYWVRASNGSAVRVYCDMTLSCGNITGGWMRVAELDMTDTRQQCPDDFVQKDEESIRQCRIPGNTCYSVYYTTADVSYSRVCGRITAYQVGTTNAFLHYYKNEGTINSTYVDGVSLTHGNSRQHIWTFAAALDKNRINNLNSKCPCVETSNIHPPPFVGDDYFCDTGSMSKPRNDDFLTEPLWDGTDCLCCDNPPWFYKQLPQPTTDDIEMRVCKDTSYENIAITEIEIYIRQGSEVC